MGSKSTKLFQTSYVNGSLSVPELSRAKSALVAATMTSHIKFPKGIVQLQLYSNIITICTDFVDGQECFAVSKIVSWPSGQTAQNKSLLNWKWPMIIVLYSSYQFPTTYKLFSHLCILFIILCCVDLQNNLLEVYFMFCSLMKWSVCPNP